MTWDRIDNEWVTNHKKDLYDFYCSERDVDPSWNWVVKLKFFTDGRKYIEIMLHFTHPQKGEMGFTGVIMSEVDNVSLPHFIELLRDKKLTSLI
jgi:hypothetical protein